MAPRINRTDALAAYLGPRFKVLCHSRGPVWTIQKVSAGWTTTQRVVVRWTDRHGVWAVQQVTTQYVVFLNPLEGTVDLGPLGNCPIVGAEEKFVGITNSLEAARRLAAQAQRDNPGWSSDYSTDFGRHPVNVDWNVAAAA